MTAFVLIIIGALNIGLTAIGYNVLNMILGGTPAVEQAVNVLIGLSAIYKLVTHRAHCKTCKA